MQLLIVRKNKDKINDLPIEYLQSKKDAQSALLNYIRKRRIT